MSTPKHIVFTRWAAAILLCLLLASCSVIRRVPRDSYLLVRNKMEVEKEHGLKKSELVDDEDLQPYIRQQPASRFLGTQLPLWIYTQANPGSNTWWNRLKRRIGSQPVILDTTLTKASVDGMKIYMDARGFLNSEAYYILDTARRKAKVTYHVDQGDTYRIGDIRYLFRDDFVESVILDDTVNTLLKRGNVFDVNVLDNERARITDYLQNQGYYNFSVNNIGYIADTTAGSFTIDLTLIVRRYNSGYDTDGQPVMENNRVYRIQDIYVYSNYSPTAVADPDYQDRLDTVSYRGLHIVYDRKQNVRAEILRRAIQIYPNYLYNAEGVKRTYDNIMRLGYFRSARILFDTVPTGLSTDNLISYIGDEDTDLTDTLHTIYTEERYLNCTIYCTPATRQGYTIDLEGTTAADYFGILAKVGYQNRNLFKGAGLFDISLRTGYEFVQSTGVKTRNSYELGGSVSFSFPQFVTPFRVDRYNKTFNPRTKVDVSYLIQNRKFYNRTISGGGWGYQWGNGKNSSFVVRPIDISVVKLRSIDSTFYADLKNPYLQNSYTSQIIAGFSGGYIFSNQTTNLNPLTMRFNVETNGNLIDGLAHLFNARTYTDVPEDPKMDPDSYRRLFGVRYAQFFRVDANLSKKIMVGKKSNLVYRFYAGWGFAYGNSSSVPFERLFYSGGVNSMRGWGARTLGPGNLETDIQNNRGAGIYPSQLGNLKLETNLEARFPVWGVLHGAVFTDVGNIWFARQGYSNEDRDKFKLDNFYSQLGWNTGIGMRLDFNFFVFRVDWGIQIHNPNKKWGERWVISNFHLDNSALSFGIGYPF